MIQHRTTTTACAIVSEGTHDQEGWTNILRPPRRWEHMKWKWRSKHSRDLFVRKLWKLKPEQFHGRLSWDVTELVKMLMDGTAGPRPSKRRLKADAKRRAQETREIAERAEKTRELFDLIETSPSSVTKLGQRDAVPVEHLPWLFHDGEGYFEDTSGSVGEPE